MDFLAKLNLTHVPIDNLACQSESCDFIGKTVQELLIHYRKNHDSDKDFESVCLYSCNKTFKTVSGLHSHLRRTHPSFFKVESQKDALSERYQLLDQPIEAPGVFFIKYFISFRIILMYFYHCRS